MGVERTMSELPHFSARKIDVSDWFGQPRGLTILFLTEMWTQFSFYGMRALLVLYMTKQLLIDQQKASWIYGLYAATVYLTPVLGGIIADRWIGRRRAVIIGGLIMMIGHFIMANEGLLYIALGTIAVGNGLFLPGLASQIDGLYDATDQRRKSAYNIYYVGINLGAFGAPIVIGTVGEVYGYHLGFAIAGFGMIVALITYLAGGKYLPSQQMKEPAIFLPKSEVDDQPTRPFKHRFLLLLAIAAAVVVFRGAYEQIGNTLSLWIDQGVNRNVTATLAIPVTWFQSLNPIVVFALTPVFVAQWARLASHEREPGSVQKMAFGAGIVGLAYLLAAAIAFWGHHQGNLIAWPWLVAFIILMTAGELWILPVGLGFFGRLAPNGLTATTIALWFSAGFFGNLVAAWLGTFWSEFSNGTFFIVIACVAFVAALWLMGLVAWATKTEEDAVATFENVAV
jgi:proton-dependent oligopeptide transporter, POT family